MLQAKGLAENTRIRRLSVVRSMLNQTASAMPTPRDHAAAAVVGGRLYIAGGRPGEVRTVEVYDPTRDAWTTAPPLPVGRSAVAGAAWDGRFLVLGGEDAGEQRVLSRVDAYDPQTRRWTAMPDLPTSLQGIGAAVVGGRLYLLGGGPVAGGSRQSATLLVLG